MKKWHSLLEYVQFPLKMLFIATILLGIGSTIINPNVDPLLWHIDNDIVIVVSEMMRYLGGYMIRFFPLFVFFKILMRRYEDSVPAFVGLFGYIILNVVMMFFANSTLPTYLYENTLGIQANFQAASFFGEATKVPYMTGIFSLLVVYYIVKKSYERSRHHSMHGLLSFIDHDTWALITSLLLCVVAGIAFAFLWPYFLDLIQSIFAMIGNDISDPVNLFFYGILERVMAVFNLVDLPRNAFWLGDMGGSFMEPTGLKHVGDVSIWSYQIMNNLDLTAGKFITPYYVINIFVIPSFLLAYLSLTSSKKERGRYMLFIVLALVFSILCGNPLPMEILMLVLAPLLYVFYLVMIGLIYAALQIMDVSIGYNFSDALIVANPGSLLDLPQFFRNPTVSGDLIGILIVGVICFVVFFVVTRAYFKKYAIGLLQLSNRKVVTNKIINAVGGIDNIKSVDSTPDKLTFILEDRLLIDVDSLRKEGAYLILEAKEGYLVRLGNISTIVAEEINKLIKDKPVKEMVESNTEIDEVS
ncbi:MAG: PTS transporter subunit EIIC [Erysipelotrichaceae bacterium]